MAEPYFKGGPKPQTLEETAEDLYGIGSYLSLMAPSAGISDVLGFAPDPSKVGDTMPSFSENIESGNYLDAGLQTLGASGDVMLAASPFFPVLAVPAAVVKGISTVGKSMRGASKSSKVPDDLNLGSGSLFNSDTKRGRKLLIVSCSASKCPDPGDMEAFDRYTGDMYKSMKKVGVPEENVDLAIMSAKYGLIRRDTPIPTYNVKMDKEIAGNLLNDPDQVNRIKNTIAGYDEVVVEGSDLYKGVVKEAAGDIPLRDFKVDFKKAVELGEVKPDGGYGSGRQKESVGNFLRSNTPQEVFHYSPDAELGFTIFDPDKAPSALDALGTHVGSPKAARDRFETLRPAQSKFATGNLGYDESGVPIARTTFGGTYPLKANLSKPYSPRGKAGARRSDVDVWDEEGINVHLLTEYNKDRFGDAFSPKAYDMGHLVGDKPDFPFSDFRKFIGEFRLKLADEGFTHLPYYNDVEDVGSLSYVMLTDRPKGSAAVLKGKFGANDLTQRTNPDIMKEDGGVISLKDKAVNMNRGPQGIEPFIKYMQKGGLAQDISEQPTTEELQNIIDQYAKTKAAYDVADRFSAQTPFSKYSSPEDQNFIPNKEVNPEIYKQYQDYKSGVEFGDTETGMDLLSATKFDPLLQAGLRDMRSLSDYAQIIKQERRGTIDKALNIGGMYNPISNSLMVMPNAMSGETLAHELMHKGAEYLARDSKALQSLRRGGKAEHRYIQAVVNTAFMKKMMNEQASYLNQLFSQKDLSEQRKANIRSAVLGENKNTLLREVDRVMQFYYSPENRTTLFSELEKRLDITPRMLADIQRGDLQVDMETVKQIFSITNEVMANDFASSRFGKNFKRAFDKSDRQEGFFDMRLLEQPEKEQATEQAPPTRGMNQGGVISLKDRAVKMHRNVV